MYRKRCFAWIGYRVNSSDSHAKAHTRTFELAMSTQRGVGTAQQRVFRRRILDRRRSLAKLNRHLDLTRPYFPCMERERHVKVITSRVDLSYIALDPKRGLWTGVEPQRILARVSMSIAYHAPTGMIEQIKDYYTHESTRARSIAHIA